MRVRPTVLFLFLFSRVRLSTNLRGLILFLEFGNAEVDLDGKSTSPESIWIISLNSDNNHMLDYYSRKENEYSAQSDLCSDWFCL